jgi:uncharacterized short protein YbdD (DUF466 family)
MPGAPTMPKVRRSLTTLEKVRLGLIDMQEYVNKAAKMWATRYQEVETRREYFEELAKNLVKLNDWTDIALIISKFKREDLMFMQTCKLPQGLRRIVQLAAVVKTVREKWEKGEEIVKIIVGFSDYS